MALLVDLFGYLSVVVHGLVIVAQSVAFGSVFFLALLLRPLAGRLGPDGINLTASVGRVVVWSAVGLVLAEALYIGLQVAVMLDTTGMDLGKALTASFALSGLAKAVCAALIATLVVAWGPRASAPALVVLSLLALAAATATTHAAGRVGDRSVLLGVEFLHQLGAALWIGGIPVFWLALSRLPDGVALGLVGTRFSRMSMAGVAALLVSGTVMSVVYIGDVPGLYGTAFGVMVGAKIVMFLMLLGLGLGNFLVVERLRREPAGSTVRLRRFAEAEIGIGFTIFFAAASLTSVPPAIDLTDDRVTFAEIVERNTPRMPRLVSPDHDQLSITTLQNKLDAEAATASAAPKAAFTPGSGELPPRDAADIAWSEYNHHWAGLFVVAIGILALLAQAGIGWARHWPLVFVGLGTFLAVRADPDVWPLGSQGVIESLRDVETLQHRAFEVLIFAFAFFEWRVRRLDIRTGWQPLVFPLMCAAGGMLLLTHQHAISNVKDQLLVELTHTPLAIAGVAAGWARWLELRLDPVADRRLVRVAGWVWPACLLVIGMFLLLYREA